MDFGEEILQVADSPAQWNFLPFLAFSIFISDQNLKKTGSFLNDILLDFIFDDFFNLFFF